MSDPAPARDAGTDRDAPWWPGAWPLALALVVYLVALAAATWPFALRFGRGLPASWIDPYQHLWVMRWYRTCLLEGRWPVFCPEVQQPVGAPMGLFSPLQLASLLFVPLSLVLDDDILCYDLVWTASLLLTGLGVYILGWWVTRDRAAALVAGLVAMLGAPVLLQAHAAVELIQLGGLALFLMAWLRFVDAPSRGRLLAAVGLYAAVGLGAAYFAIFVVFPAALYVAWEWLRAGRGARRAWLRPRLGWLAAFGVLAALAMGLVFFNQIWAQAQGFPMVRLRAQFAEFRAPAWAYLVPTPLNTIGRRLPGWVNAPDRIHPIGFSYLGAVPIALAALAAVARVRFPRAGYWWAALALVVVLSAGDSWTIAGRTIPMPAGWLRDHTPLFAPIRVPARFNLLAVVLAAVPAAAGLAWLLRRRALRHPAARWSVVGLLLVTATADLAMVPFWEEPRPALPGAYAFLRRHDPDATWVEIPQFGTDGANHLSAATLYWQSLHRGKTTAGYSGQGNVRADNRLVWSSPFWVVHLINPDYLKQPDAIHYDLTPGVRFADQAWLYLRAHDLDYVVLHEWPGATSEFSVHLDRIKALLEPAKIYSDGLATVYDRSRLPEPARPTVLCTEGWGYLRAYRQRGTRSLARTAKLAVYSPDEARPVHLSLDLTAFRRPRMVRLLDARGAELARWSVDPKDFRACVSPPLRLARGYHELTLASDGEERPRKRREASGEGDLSPYSLISSRVEVVPALDVAAQPDSARR